MLNEAGADTRSLLTVEGKTGQATIQVDEKGENAILIYPGANARITREHIRSALAGMERGDYLLLQNEINELEYIIKSGGVVAKGGGEKIHCMSIIGQIEGHYGDYCRAAEVFYDATDITELIREVADDAFSRTEAEKRI